MKHLYYLFFGFSFAFAQVPSVWWVDGASGSDNNDGKTEAAAFKTVQKVFDSYLLGNYVDTIKVKPGTYDFSDGYISNISKSFVMLGTDGANQTIFDAGNENNHFYISISSDDKIVFDGITFRNGNYKQNNGGALTIYGTVTVDFKNSYFEKNKAEYYGGAVSIGGRSQANFESCVFIENEAGYGGGAVYYEQTYEAKIRNAFATVSNSKFFQNKVKSDTEAFGGALGSYRQIDVINSVFADNFVEGGYTNYGYRVAGGAVYLEVSSYDGQQQQFIGGDSRIINSTFDGNYINSKSDYMGSAWGGTISYGGWNQANSKTLIFNTIITNSVVYQNGEVFTHNDNSQDVPGLVVGTVNSQYFKVYADYSNIQDGVNETWAGNNVYDADPGFKDKLNRDYSLSDKSPLIGMGALTWSDWDLNAPQKDIAGSSRPDPVGSSPDLGAYENVNSVMAGPMPPRNFVVKAISYGAKLNWSPSTKGLNNPTLQDNIEYQIYKDGQLLTTSKDTIYTATGLTLGTAYSFSVSALKTDDSSESVRVGPVSVVPTYLGPWYVATSGGKSPNNAQNNSEYGSKNYPINHLTSALEVAAAGDTIIMMEGTHSGVTNRNISIEKQIVITGDPTKSADKTIIDAEHKARHFSFNANNIYNENQPQADSSWAIQNITLYRGKTSGDNWQAAGGSVRIGGKSSPKFFNVIFRQNIDESTQGWTGAAIYADAEAVLNVDQCQFIDNSVINSDGDVFGGAVGLASYTQSPHKINASIFKGNKVEGKYSASGSAIATNSAMFLTNSLFYNNLTLSPQGSARAAIAMDAPSAYYNKYSLFINNTIVNNDASAAPGFNNISGIFLRDYDYHGGGVNEKHTLYAFNNIIYGNTARQDVSPVQLENFDLKADYNIIQNLDAALSANQGLSFDYTYDFDPAFTDSANGDFTLSGTSLALGKGIATWDTYLSLNAPLKDLSGKQRPFPTGSNPDLGAYENELSKSPAPPPIEGLVAKGGSGQIQLTWNASPDKTEDPNIQYKVYMDTKTVTRSNSTLVKETQDTTYTQTGLNNASRYYFQVTAVNSGGYESAPTSIDLSPSHTGPVWWVATNGSDQNGDGSVGGPLASIQKAMERAASGDTIMLKPGTYKTAQMTYPFSVFDNSTGQQSAFKKLDSLVIRSQKGAASTILDAEYEDRHFEFFPSGDISVDSSFQFIGLTFKGGRSPDRGGSFLLENNSHVGGGFFPGFEQHSTVLRPKFVDCVFIDNAVGGDQFYGQGGAFYIENAFPIFENCTFESNYADAGGALYFSGNLDYELEETFIRNSVFRNNDAFSDKGDGQGGAIAVGVVQKLTILNSLFERNEAGSSNFHARGGAVYISSDWDPFIGSSVEILNSRFSLNRTFSSVNPADGGAIYVGAPLKMHGSVVDSNHVAAYGQNQFGAGAGIYIDLFSINKSGGNHKGTVELINNTIVNNFAEGSVQGIGGGIADMNIDQHENIWFNNIIWGNGTNDPNSFSNGIHMQVQSNGNVRDQGTSWNGYNNIQDLETLQQAYNYDFGENTISVDPSFKSIGSLQLSDASPLIGAGTKIFQGNIAPSKDIDGNRRPSPSGSNPDIGAYENGLAKSPYPDQVRNLSAEELTQSIQLNWAANNALNIMHYNVYYSLNKIIDRSELTKAVSTADTMYLVTNLKNGTEYHFVVSAVDSSNFEGPFSEMVSAIPKFDGPNWWVDASASADGDGSFESPFNTIGQAVFEVAERGDTIRIQSGSYLESNMFFNGSDQFQPGGQPGGDDVLQNIVKEIAIIGAGAQNTFIDADFSGPHLTFNELESVFIRGITFTKGYSENFGGSLQSNNTDSLVIRNVIFDDNQVSRGGGAIAMNGGELQAVNVLFNNNRVSFFDSDIDNGQGGAVVLFNGGNPEDNDYSYGTFDNCVFQENMIIGNANGASGTGAAIHVNDGVGIEVVRSKFELNRINVQGGQDSRANAIISVHTGSTTSWSEYPDITIHQSLFSDNFMVSQGATHASIFDAGVPFSFHNNLVIENYAQNALTMIFTNSLPDQAGTSGSSYILNNTFYANSGNSSFVDVAGDKEYVNITNNIIWANNKGQNESSDFYRGNNATVYINNNIFESGANGGTQVDNINDSPKLRNPASGDYRLQGNSPAIDAGVDIGEIFDYRGFYRTGLPDIGAFESGASKYILAIEDDIVGNEDTTFVSREDTLEFTITTNDIDGNLVNSNESVQWSIFPSAKYVNLISSDPTTSGGSATAKFKVSEQAKGKGFRFRIEAELGESIMRSEMYVIEELVTGAPPPVPVLTISPDGWSTEPNFTIAWTIPNWSEDRDLLGAIVQVNDGVNFYDEFVGFPENNPLKAYAFSVPEAGAFNASVRLMDEYGNEDPDSAKTIQALYDDIKPESFYINWPNSYADPGGNMEVNWVSDKPRFEWQHFEDYPSGIEKWVVYVNGEEYGTYTENSIEFVEQDAAIQDTAKALEDGTYEWYIKTVDFAENSTNSDTGYFGVDLNPPSIVHNNPLISVDEGSTTPSINAQVSDGGSGVKSVRLNYRRSGSNGGFVTVELWSDGQVSPSSIPGGDIRSEGVEYFIEAEDELGNRSQWPFDYNGNFVQSVVARTQNNVTTADYWAAGIPTGTDTSAYQLFSIPFNTNKGLNAITEVLGPPDEFKYRLYGWNNGWDEFTELNPINISLGDAYFFIWDKDKYPDLLQLNFDFGKGESTPTSPPFEIPAAVGEWKFFGNPYNFPVNLVNVRTQADIPITDEGSIFTWSTFGGWTNPGSVLEPWKGYIYKSATDPDIYVDGTGDVFGKRLAKTTTPEINNTSMDVDEWVVNILASTGRSRDESNSIGVLKMASDGHDRLDEFEPPLVPGNISLSIDNRDRDEVPDIYSVDIRKPNDEGHYWDLEVIAPTNGQRTYLTFEGLGYVPEEYDIFIINKTNKQAQNLKWENGYRFANTGSGSYLKQDLRLVIGSKKFVEQNNAGVSLYPDAFVLSQNYPNPFNPQTSIKISLQEEARVDLVVYNLLGEEITRLSSNELRSAGYYNFIWNGMNTAGNKVSTGVYLYHAMVKDKNGKMVLNKTKKMVFLK